MRWELRRALSVAMTIFRALRRGENVSITFSEPTPLGSGNLFIVRPRQ